jgi:S-adenosylmethionine hydrolase
MKMQLMRDIVTLMTDFGWEDSYVSEMKGVLLEKRPLVEIVDITHSIPSFDKSTARFQLWRAYRWFPKQTCHLAIVDPGVGGDRKNLFIQTELGNFLGPDNGILSWAVEDAEKRSKKPAMVYEIPPIENISPTFYGRDLFIPFLAHFLSGQALRLNRLDSFEREGFPENKKTKNTLRTKVIHVDKFGNGVLAVSPFEFPEVCLNWKKNKVVVYPHYQAIPKKKAGLIAGSHGMWEIAAASASAAKMLGFKKDDEVVLQML